MASLYLFCLVVAIILSPVVAPRVARAATQADIRNNKENIVEKPKPSVSLKHHVKEQTEPVKLKIKKIFEPIVMNFPDTPKRTAAQAKKYVDDLLLTLPKRYRKEDENLKMTGDHCARGLGHLYLVKDDDGNLVYSICFNDNSLSAIYAEVFLYLVDKVLDHTEHQAFKEKYNLAGLKPLTANQRYSATNQTEVFNQVFEPFTEADYRLALSFTRNHIVPHAALEAILRKFTYYLRNCFPGWQSMNARNYAKVEGYANIISIILKVQLRIFTGLYGILQKKTLKGPMADVYLDPQNKKIEVPLVVWKLVINVENNATIAFFTSNDIHMDEDQIEHFLTLCESKCEELGYHFSPDVKAGITLCCSYEDFLRHIPFLPIKLTKKSEMIRNPKPDSKSRSTSPAARTKPSTETPIRPPAKPSSRTTIDQLPKPSTPAARQPSRSATYPSTGQPSGASVEPPTRPAAKSSTKLSSGATTDQPPKPPIPATRRSTRSTNPSTVQPSEPFTEPPAKPASTPVPEAPTPPTRRSTRLAAGASVDQPPEPFTEPPTEPPAKPASKSTTGQAPKPATPATRRFTRSSKPSTDEPPAPAIKPPPPATGRFTRSSKLPTDEATAPAIKAPSKLPSKSSSKPSPDKPPKSATKPVTRSSTKAATDAPPNPSVFARIKKSAGKLFGGSKKNKE